MSEKYVNYYVEIMTGTMQDAVLRNISLQANSKVSEELLHEQQNRIQELEHEIEKRSSEAEQIRKLNEELSSAKNNYESVRHQVTHIDTFRNELVKERDEHQKTRNEYDKKIQELTLEFVGQLKLLQDKIEYLQLSPAKRKKLDDAKNVVEEKKEIIPLSSAIVKKKTLEVVPHETKVDNSQEEDGGTF
jgi:DNA repair exonuclease SbcCD ATPase subunit